MSNKNSNNKSAKSGSRPGPKQNSVKKGPSNSQPRNALVNARGSMSYAQVAKSRQTKTSVPRMVTLKNGDCHVVHREYIQDISAEATSPSKFNSTTLSLNPGQASVFPWLSKIAQNFESYRFDKLRFLYETEAPSSLGGTLVLTVDYDSGDTAPTTKQQALTYRGAVRSAPWSECQHTSLKEDLSKQKTYFVRPGAQPAGTDVKTYDTGNLFVITQGVTTGSAVCGELYVEYDVLLMTPNYVSVFTYGSIFAATSTVASPFLNGVITGNLISGQNLTTVSLQNLVAGQEYFWAHGYTSNQAGNPTFGTLVGITAKTNPIYSGSEVFGFTFTANASVGSFNITQSAAGTNLIGVVTPITSSV